jgi:hypothetical protein
MSRLASRQESSLEKQERNVKSLCGLIRQRADVIMTADVYRQKTAGRCMDAGAWDSYSTPSRDEQIRHFIKLIEFNGTTIAILEDCGKIRIDSSSKEYRISELIENFRRGATTHDPNESIMAKWGFDHSKNNCAEPKIR